MANNSFEDRKLKVPAVQEARLITSRFKYIVLQMLTIYCTIITDSRGLGCWSAFSMAELWFKMTVSSEFRTLSKFCNNEKKVCNTIMHWETGQVISAQFLGASQKLQHALEKSQREPYFQSCLHVIEWLLCSCYWHWRLHVVVVAAAVYDVSVSVLWVMVDPSQANLHLPIFTHRNLTTAVRDVITFTVCLTPPASCIKSLCTSTDT